MCRWVEEGGRLPETQRATQNLFGCPQPGQEAVLGTDLAISQEDPRAWHLLALLAVSFPHETEFLCFS